jgi:HAD superfamily hydrolase (TIGR01490 family)
MSAVAFFDLDRTLIAVNSATLWLVQELRDGNVSTLDGLRAMTWLARYSLGAANVEHALLATVEGVAGRDEAAVTAGTERFYERQVHPQLRPGGLAALAQHRAQGDLLVLLTSSSEYLSRLIVRDLGLDDYLCTRLEVDADGRFTGKPKGRICFGPGKLEAAETWLAGRGIALGDCSFYTDSASDLPVLEAVGHPVAVNPDVRLARMARQRGWPVVDWGRPGAKVAHG